DVSGGAAFLALMVFEGGIYTIMLTGLLAGVLSLCWSLQEKNWIPLGVLLLTFSLGSGLSALKLAPVAKLMLEDPRETPLGGNGWKIAFTGSGSKPSSNGVKASAATGSRWALVQQLIMVFFGRDQRGNEWYFPQQGFGWQEYGAYLGPVVVGLVALFPL